MKNKLYGSPCQSGGAKCKWIFTLIAVLCFVAAFSEKTMAADSNVPYVEVWKSNTYTSADLYFRYDNLLETDRTSRVTTGSTLTSTYLLNDLDAEGYPNWIYDALVSKIQTVHFTDFTYKPTSCKGWFKGMTTLKWVMDFQSLNTEDVTDMSEMFSGCSGIEFDASGFRPWNLSMLNTQKVTDMHDMFKGCSGSYFTSLSVGANWNTSNVTDMSGMFYGCSSLTSIDFDKFTTNKVTDMHDMFNGCNNIGNFVFPATFKTDNVTDMSGMFANCTKVTNIDISNFNTSKVENMEKMFYNFKGVSTISISNNTSKVKSMESMFEVSGFTSISFNGSFSTESVENMKNMFAWCKFESIDVSSFKTGKVKDMSYMFYYCKQLSSLDLSSFNTSNVENMDNMFQTCVELASIDVSSFNTKKVKSMKTMFYECYKLTSLDLSSFETDNVENMSNLFGECYELETLDFDSEKFKTDNVQDMSYMFHFCTKLKSLDVSKFNTANVTNMACMFDDCKLLEVIDVSGFNTAKVTNMHSMFTDCQAVKKLEFNPTYFNTSNVTNMAGMFHNCAALKYLDLSMFNTEKVTNMMMMFSCMASVEWLDLSNFDTKNVTNMSQMFEMNEKLNTILVSPDDWTLLSTLTANHMFGFINTQELIGNKGTIFKSANSTDQNYAHIDEGTSNPGYFTTGRFKIFYNGIDNDDETLDIYTDAITEIPDGEVTLIEPSKEGFAFDGWTGSSATGLSSKVASVTIPSGSKGNRIYTAHWKINQYTLTFDTDGGSDFLATTLKDYGADLSYISALSDPTKTGYDFVKWDKVIPTTMPATDLTITALWTPTVYNINLDYDGGALPTGKSNPTTFTIETETFTLEKPEKTGYTFAGWHTGKTVDPDGVITKGYYAQDLDYTATWDVNQYTITFNTDGGSVVAAITQDYNSAITAPADPTKEYYKFIGWDKPIPATMPAENITLTAQWEGIPHTITFDTDGGTPIDKMTVKYGENITKPADPVKTGYTFLGWNKQIPETMPDEDLTFKAQWQINQYTITFDTDGADPIEAITQYYNTAITAPANPAKKGFTFLGWQPALPATMPAQDLTVKAQWRDDRETIAVDFNGTTSFPTDADKFCNGNETSISLPFTITKGQPSEYIVTFENGTVVNGKVDANNNVLIEIPNDLESGVYKGSVVFNGDPELYKESEAYPVAITANIPKNAALQIYSDVLLVDNHDNNYSAYQWYKDGNAISGATLQFYSEPSFSGRYTVKITDKDGKEFMSCPVKTGVSVKNTKSSVKVYPNPATSGEQFTLEIEEYDPAKDYTIMIFTANGTLVKKLTGLEKINTTTLPGGIYSGSLISNGEKSGFKVIVK